MNPYTDTRDKTWIIRKFSKTTQPNELVWHRDRRSRIIEVLSGSGWHIQLDNQLPTLLESGNRIYIEKEIWHRLHKGIDDLILKITEE